MEEKIDHRSFNDVFQKPINGIRECKWCHQNFENITGSQLANHVRWCKENPNRGKGLKEKLQTFKEKEMLKKFGPYKDFEVKCSNPKCSNVVIVHKREKKFPQKEHYFCSGYCSHSYSAQHTDPKKISFGVKKFISEHPIIYLNNNTSPKTIHLRKIEICKCLWCGNNFETTILQKCCCNSCAVRYKNFRLFNEKLGLVKDDYERTKLLLRRYRIACSFTFGIKSFPNEFDFSLIEKYGWYAAKNHGNNLNGVSRDHMFSVKDGFINYIDPIFISHPANCRLIRHNDNVSKLDESLFSRDELLQRIIAWDLRNGKFNELMNYSKFNDKFDWNIKFTTIL